MHATNFLTFAIAGLAAAQTTSSSSAVSGCGTQIDLIISTCLGSTKAIYDTCKPTDWDCLCTQSINVLTCYNNCPSAPDRFGYEQTKVANCNAASVYGTSSKATATATASDSSSGSVSAVVAAATTTSASESSTRTGSASASEASASETGAAVGNVIPAGVLAAVFGLAALI